MAIPVPAGTDPACDFAEDWCATAAAITAKLAAYTATLSRVYPAIPIAVVRLTEQVNPMPTLTPFPFTEVVLDTAGMTDFDADPTTIVIKRSGRFTVRGWLRTNTTGVANTIIQVRIASNTPGFERNGIVLDRNTVALGDGTYETVATLLAGTKIQLLQATGVNLDILSASLSVAWHSDTERPS